MNLELPDGVINPVGKRITQIMVAGIGPILVDEAYEEFCTRLKEFMDVEHTRGELFHYQEFYSWKAEVGKMHQLHVKTEPGCLTLDGCRAIYEITVGYLTTDPIDVGRPSNGVVVPQYAMHGPGKR